jgi:hypothetical protein
VRGCLIVILLSGFCQDRLPTQVMLVARDLVVA